ncbi:2-nitropropane dioxygenase [Nocardioides sp. Root190]|uniref:NAD(P)H-dependent flavin oxidoreductase n=1 Tax=Nocardioides sp. Root190 TaxID=1736488 RepID=UPI0006F4D432|nr:nitronate monooxygenase [Nocardioides sp. Root190]KRB73211.1 2-nitropropane dioxygenase [Nocardioides sp. Root190]
MTNRVQDLLGIEIPIVQAPMTFIANAALAVAVSEAGGMGVIETLSPGGRDDLARVRELTSRPVGANLMIQGWKRDPSIVETIAESGVKYVATSAGDPALFTARLKDAGLTVFHVVGTLRAAMKAVDAGVDGLVVEGVEGGGFKSALGASTMVLLPLVASRVDVPLIAAGGISDAQSMAAAFVLGAEGVQMGTRMLATTEAAVHANFKDAIVGADDASTVLISPPSNPTMRVLRNGHSDNVLAGGPPVNLLEKITDLYFGGEMEASVANTGQVSARIDAVLPVAQVLEEMWSGCVAALEAGRARLT